MAEFAILSVVMMGLSYGTGVAANEYFGFSTRPKKLPKWAAGLLMSLGIAVLAAIALYLLWKLVKLSQTLNESQRALLPIGWMWLSRILVIVASIFLAVCAARPQIVWWVTAALSVVIAFVVMYMAYTRSQAFREATDKNATVTVFKSEATHTSNAVHDEGDVQLSLMSDEGKFDVRSV